MNTTVSPLQIPTKKSSFRIALSALSLCLISVTTLAQGNHHIHVNGVLMSPAQVAVLEQLAGGHIPDGHYWYNPYTGEWGSGDFPTADQNDYQQATDKTSSDSPYWEDRMSKYGIDVPSTVIYP